MTAGLFMFAYHVGLSALSPSHTALAVLLIRLSSCRSF